MVIALAVFACEVDEGERFDRVIHLQPEPRAGVEWEEAALVQIGAESRRAWRVQSGHSIELRALVPGARVLIESTVVEGPLSDHFEVVRAVVTPDANGRSSLWKLTLRADSALPPGQFNGTLRVVLDDDQNPEVRCRFRGFVRRAP